MSVRAGKAHRAPWLELDALCETDQAEELQACMSSFRHPPRNLLICLGFGALAMWTAWALLRQGDLGWLPAPFAAFGIVALVLAWYHATIYEIGPDGVSVRRLLFERRIRWAEVTAVDDFGHSLCIVSSGKKLWIGGDVRGIDQIRSLVDRYRPALPKTAQLPIIVCIGRTYQFVAVGSTAAWAVVAVLSAAYGFGASAPQQALVAILGVAICASYLVYLRAYRWVFRDDSIEVVRPFHSGTFAASDVISVRVEKHTQHFQSLEVAQAKLIVDLQSEPSIEMHAAKIDQPVEKIRLALVEAYGIARQP